VLPPPSEASTTANAHVPAAGQLTNSAQVRPSMVDVAQVQGQVHAQSVHRVGELAEQNPTETASIIRQWLAEPA
jgi:flagellar M-ring protein FliF